MRAPLLIDSCSEIAERSQALHFPQKPVLVGRMWIWLHSLSTKGIDNIAGGEGSSADLSAPGFVPSDVESHTHDSDVIAPTQQREASHKRPLSPLVSTTISASGASSAARNIPICLSGGGQWMRRRDSVTRRPNQFHSNLQGTPGIATCQKYERFP